MRLLYDVDDPAAMARFAVASAAGEALAYSSRIWHMQAAPSDRTTARLEYTRKPGAESCLDESGLRIEVARRSGYDPFTSDPTRVRAWS